MSKKTIKVLLIAVLLILTVSGAPKRPAPYSLLSENNIEAAFCFSPEGGFYNEDIVVDMSAVYDMYPRSRVFFTIDGTIPDTDSYLYTEPVIIKAGGDVRAVTIKACVYGRDDGKAAAGPFVATYFMGITPENDSDVIYVSITSDEEGLYSEETGILYPMADCGTTAEDWKYFEKQNCKQRSIDIYDDRWIRRAYVEIYDSEGDQIMSQGTGLCVDGDHGSMIHYPYSLKLLANKIFDPDRPAFSRELFRYYNKGAVDYSHVQDYNNLVFRNGGNEYIPGTMNIRHAGRLYAPKHEDQVSEPIPLSDEEKRVMLGESNGTMLRWAVGSRLSEEAGLMCAGNRSAVVFLNGELYGAMSLLDTYNRYNTAEKARVHKDSIEIWKDAEKAVTDNAGYEDLYYAYPDIENSPILDPENQEAFEALVDIEDMFRYYAVELMLNNTDFPKKNYAIWRGGQNNMPRTGSVYDDGKYRFLINDLDCIYDFRYDDDLWVAYFDNIKTDGTLMGSLIQVDRYRDMFINILCDVMNSGLFDEDHINIVFDEAEAGFAPAARVAYPESVNEKRIENLERMRTWAIQRKDQVRGYIRGTFAPEAPYELQVKAPDEGAVISFSSVDLRNIDGDYSGLYYGDYPMNLTFSSNDNVIFKGWMINGRLFEGEFLTLNRDNIWDGRIEIELLTQRKSTTPEDSLMISEVGQDEDGAWIELYNASDNTVDLSEFYLSNDELLSVKRDSLPREELKPGEVYVTRSDPEGRFILEQDAVVYLQYRDGRIADELRIPVLGSGESYGRYGETDVYRYYPYPTKGVSQ